MGKEEIKALIRKITELGPHFEKITRIIPVKGSEKPIIVEKYARTAIEEQFFDRFGRPDDDEAARRVDIDLRDAVMKLYQFIKVELTSRGHYDKLIHILEEKDYIDNFYKLLHWCLDKARLLGIDVAHDRYYKSTVIKGESNIPIGQKMLSEKQAEREYKEEE